MSTKLKKCEKDKKCSTCIIDCKNKNPIDQSKGSYKLEGDQYSCIWNDCIYNELSHNYKF